LTLILLIVTMVPYENSLDPVMTPSNTASHPEPRFLTHFHNIWTFLKHMENW